MSAIASGLIIGGVSVAGSIISSDAIGDAAQAQADAAARGEAQARADLQPYAQAGYETLPTLTDLVTNPQAQADYLANNPFYDLMVQQNQNAILSNAAARGKVGSGGTAEALQTSALLTGNQLLNQTITQQQNLATLGANAAAGQATATQNAAIAQGNALSAGAIAQGNVITGTIDQLGSLYLGSLGI